MSPDDFYDQLRRQVVSEPKQARAAVTGLLRDRSALLSDVLDLASRPGEGRIRQVIALAARLSQTTCTIEDRLRSWEANEPDEFTRGEITAALDSIQPTPLVTSQAFEMPQHFVDAYRYTSERLCHRVRNPLTRSASLLLRLQRAARTTTDPELSSELTDLYRDLQSMVHRVGNVVEFDIDDAHTNWRLIPLGDWLKAAIPRFTSRFGPAALLLPGSVQANSTCVRANGFLLETVFGNAWANAIQASEETDGKGCRITAELSVTNSWLDILLYDDGPGFSDQQLDMAFRAPFSTKAERRGRGLLEIAEAVGRMQGKVRLVEVARGEYRMLIHLPVGTP